MTLANPKIIVFYLAVLPTLRDLRAVSVSDFTVLVTVTALVLVAAMRPYAALASRARHALQTAAFHRPLNRGGAAIMAGAAIGTAAGRV